MISASLSQVCATIFLILPSLMMLIGLIKGELASMGLWFMAQIMLLDFLSRIAKQMTRDEAIDGVCAWVRNPTFKTRNYP